MKKSLVALAALAVIGAASAQSSVTMYGVADLSLSDTNKAGDTAQMSGNGVMNNGSSRLGVRGTEDLGGGLKASFNFEQAINAETGATRTAGFDRAANLSLSGNFGTFMMGRTLTPSFFGVATWELTGQANYSVVNSQFGADTRGPTVNPRNNSQFSYTSPTMGGVSGTLGYIFKADNGGNAKADANLKYVAGPVAVGLSYNKVQNAERNVALGAKYDFGMFQMAASYQDPAGVKKGFTVGGTANLGPVIVTLDAARNTGSGYETATFAPAPAVAANFVAKSTNVLLEAKYPLSKRTFAYAAMLREGSVRNTNNAGVTTFASVNNYGIGLRHNF